MKTRASLALVGAMYIYLAPLGLTAEKDAAYYQRTGTKPPVQGEFVMGPSLHYSEQLSPGVSFGYVWKETGIALVGDFAAMRVDGRSGETPFQVGCRSFQVPYEVGGYTRGQVSLSLLVPLKSYAKAAK